jgi:adenine/guanine phosphoribosyltransferase-like PRPP-binding protein
MSEMLPVIVATIAALGAIIAASLAAHSAGAARRANRVTELEHTIEELHGDRHQLWLYARELTDHIYRGKPPPPPAPPPGLFE